MSAEGKKYAFPIDHDANFISISRLRSVIPRLNCLSFTNIGDAEEICEVDNDNITLDMYQDEYMAIFNQPAEVPIPSKAPTTKSTQAGYVRTRAILEKLRNGPEKVEVVAKKVMNIYILI